MPRELAYVDLALAPSRLGWGGGAWDPAAVRDWPEQMALDVLMVVAARAERQSGGGKAEY